MHARTVKLAICSLLAVSPLGGLAQSTLDQQQPLVVPLTVKGCVAVGGRYHQRLAQVVTAGTGGRLVAIAAPLVCGASSSAVLEIQGVFTDPAGRVVPDGATLSATAISAAQVPYFVDPAAPDLRMLALSVPVPLSEGDRFAFVLSSAGECALAQAPTGDLYAFGDASYDDDVSAPWREWTPLGLDRFDLTFQTWVEAAPGEAPAPEVRIDVKPGSDENPINLGARGVVPVAVLGSESFDVSQVDVASVRFAGASPVTNPRGVPRSSLEDVDADGFLDLVLHFSVGNLDLVPGDTVAQLAGATSDGQTFAASDRIVVVPARRRPLVFDSFVGATKQPRGAPPLRR